MRSSRARLAIAVCLLMGMVVAVPASAWAAWAPWMTARLVAYDGLFDTSPESRTGPEMGGKWIVWAEMLDSDPDSNIVAYNVETATYRNVTTAAGLQNDASVAGGWVVYSGYQTGDFDVYAYNVESTGFALTRNLTNRGGDQYFPDISGTKVVYEDKAAGDICVYDLATATGTVLPLGAGTQFSPRVSGDRVVYVQSGDIYVYDMKTAAAPTRLTSASLIDYDPDIDGTLVTWARDSADYTQSDILCIDLVDREPHTVATGASNQQSPRVDGTRIVYWDDVSGDQKIWIYDAQLELATALTTSAGEDDVSPCIDGDSIVYVSDRGALGGDIAWGRLVAPVLTAQISPTTVPYLGTGQLALTLAENGVTLGDVEFHVDSSHDGGHTWTQVLTGTTDPLGGFVMGTNYRTNTLYRVRYPGRVRTVGISHLVDRFSALSPVVIQYFRASVSRPSGPKSITHNRNFSSSGYLMPVHTPGTQPVVIKCYKRYSSGWKYKKTYTATVSAYNSDKCRYTATVKLTSAGSWRIRAYYPDSATNAAKYSSYRYITAK